MNKMPNERVWQRYDEPLYVTVLRTGLLGLLVGIVIASIQGPRGSWAQWTAFALWFSFGGHWVELFFLNWLRPHLASARWMQVTGRLFTWFVGGTVLMIGARMTVLSLGAHSLRLPPWWLGGPVLLCVELVVHALPQLRGQPNFYNGLR